MSLGKEQIRRVLSRPRAADDTDKGGLFVNINPSLSVSSVFTFFRPKDPLCTIGVFLSRSK